MNKKQRRIVMRSVFLIVALVPMLLFAKWLSGFSDVLKWPVFLLLMVIVLFPKGNRNEGMYTYSGRHQTFNRLIDENPWMKIYYVVYCAVVLTLVSYVYIQQVNMVEVLDMFGFAGFLGVILLIPLPVIIHRVIAAYVEAGQPD